MLNSAVGFVEFSISVLLCYNVNKSLKEAVVNSYMGTVNIATRCDVCVVDNGICIYLETVNNSNKIWHVLMCSILQYATSRV